jgi:hypothetical protein
MVFDLITVYAPWAYEDQRWSSLSARYAVESPGDMRGHFADLEAR